MRKEITYLPTCLDYSNSEFNNEKLKTLLEKYSDATTIVSIDLSKNQITDAVAKMLADFIERQEHFKFLDISSNQLSNEGVKLFAKLPIMELHINNNKITCECLPPFANNNYLLHFTYNHDRQSPKYGEFSSEVELTLKKNRSAFRSYNSYQR